MNCYNKSLQLKFAEKISVVLNQMMFPFVHVTLNYISRLVAHITSLYATIRQD